MKKSGLYIVPLLIFGVVMLLGNKLMASGAISPATMVMLGAAALILMALIRPNKQTSGTNPDATLSLLGDFSKEAFAGRETERKLYDSAVSDYLKAMPKAATGKLEKLQSKCSTDADTYAVSVALGMTKCHAGDFEAAVKLYNKAVVLHPTAELAMAIGAAQQRLGELEQARDSYEFALDLDPSSIAARSSLATAYVADGMFEQAIDEARLALEQDEEHASSLATCAICYGVLDDALLYKSYTEKAVDAGYNAGKISDTVTALKKKYRKTLADMK